MNMRGFNLMSLAPKSEVAPFELVGGQFKAFSLFELEYPIIREAGLKFVTFYDVGNSFRDFDDFKKNPVRHVLGMGIRWFSPLGPLRFEWGWPIGVKPGEDSPAFQFMIGPPF